MKTLRVETAVANPISLIFNDFWHMERFQAIWEPITQVEVKYDDGINQESLMWVNRDGQEECIRIIRFRSGWDILFFNPEPPPLMTFHRGAWRLHPHQSEGCLIVAEREYQLKRQETETREDYLCRSEQFHASFQARLEKILTFFQRHYEQHLKGSPLEQSA